MEAKDLRIGNYLEMLGKVIKIECISNLPARKEMYWITCENIIDTKIIHFKPIPLTEEWLIKFGFEKMEDLSEGIDNVTYLWTREDNSFFIESDFSFNTEYLEVKLKHVHQLQNLYLALTGEEL